MPWKYILYKYQHINLMCKYIADSWVVSKTKDKYVLIQKLYQTNREFL